ncbi:unannotated protein [freshwater metagenome]|uniref:Unannotated protein n=1 Tax=freshwater metagenome TaxID=449393 RepID=A0A6J6R327_9ZZZZ
MPSWSPAPGQDRRAWEIEVAQIRQQHETLALEAGRIIDGAERRYRGRVDRVEFHTIGTGSDAVAARVYVPEGEGPHPALLVLHGGAWWMGGGTTCFELNDPLCRRLCDEAQAIVVNLDYRLAPEHPFPVQLDDTRAALAWMHADAAGLGIDPARLGVLGMSSGANVAASTVRTLRDEGGPAVLVQVLMMPSLDMTASSPSWQAEPDQREGALRLRQLYLQDVVEPTDPRVSPLLADDFSALPPAVVVVATEDTLRDDGKLYAAALTEAGVQADLHEFVMTHIGGTDEVNELMNQAVVAGVRRHLHP